MAPLEQLETWYRQMCDGTREHSYGVSINTLDNPGWHVQIDLAGASYETLAPRKIGVDKDDADWMRCWIEGKKFEGIGDPGKLGQILGVFAEWFNLSE
jgi:hypothetical protein